MWKWLLAALPLFWSCADNEFQPIADQARLESIDFPGVLVAGWPTPLLFRVQANIPALVQDPHVVLQISGPGLAEAIRYQLLDDGDDQTLTQPGPGQADHSGDNVAGDGWFTALIQPDFSVELGTFSLRAQLLDGDDELDWQQVGRDRVVNQAPTILSLAAPDTLPSGAIFTMTCRIGDPDGLEDLLAPMLQQPGGVMRSWTFTAAADSEWTVTVGPELAAGRMGPDTLQVVATDRVGHSVSQSLAVFLENGPPSLDDAALQFSQWMGANGFQPIATGDTIHLYVPSADPADTNFYRMTIPASDPQTLADLTEVTYEITPITSTPSAQVAMADVEGTGSYTAYISLNGRPYTNTRYFLRFRAMDFFHTSEIVERIIRIHNINEAAPGPDGWPGVALMPVDPSRYEASR